MIADKAPWIKHLTIIGVEPSETSVVAARENLACAQAETGITISFKPIVSLIENITPDVWKSLKDSLYGYNILLLLLMLIIIIMKVKEVYKKPYIEYKPTTTIISGDCKTCNGYLPSFMPPQNEDPFDDSKISKIGASPFGVP
ncbi:MAG: hypothetical protein JXB49_08025 [Bacteroidales bacterium]|nr:hypothetical protein [Bacteroidales bacterium]